MIPNWRTKWKLGPDEHCQRALSFLSQGRFSRAVRHARKAAALQPNDALSHCLLGRACSATERGRYPAAYNAYLKAIKLRPQLHEPYEGLGDILEWINDHEEAIKAYTRAARLLDRSHGEKIVLHPDQSMVFISDELFGDDEKARLGRLKCRIARCYVELASDCVYSRRWKQMIEFCLAAIKHDAYSAKAHALAAQGYAHKERYDLALRMVDFADLLNQGEPGVYYHCADACFHAGRYERAIDLLNRALEHKPNCADYLFLLADAHTHNGNYSEAIACYESLAAHHPQACSDLADLYEQMGRFEDEIAARERRLAFHPDSPHFYSLLATRYRRKGMADRAIKVYERGLLKIGKNARFLFELGCTYAELGRYELAMTHLKAASEIDPDCPGLQSRVDLVLRLSKENTLK